MLNFAGVYNIVWTLVYIYLSHTLHVLKGQFIGYDALLKGNFHAHALETAIETNSESWPQAVTTEPALLKVYVTSTIFWTCHDSGSSWSAYLACVLQQKPQNDQRSSKRL